MKWPKQRKLKESSMSEEVKITKRGGARPGAGRPKKLDNKVHKAFSMDQEHVDKMKYLQAVFQCSNLSETLRTLVDSVYLEMSKPQGAL